MFLDMGAEYLVKVTSGGAYSQLSEEYFRVDVYYISYDLEDLDISPTHMTVDGG